MMWSVSEVNPRSASGLAAACVVAHRWQFSRIDLTHRIHAETAAMDLGIGGRKAIVCASSRGLGKGCARALAEAGVSLVINGRNRQALEQTAEEIRRATGVQ